MIPSPPVLKRLTRILPALLLFVILAGMLLRNPAESEETAAKKRSPQREPGPQERHGLGQTPRSPGTLLEFASQSQSFPPAQRRGWGFRGGEGLRAGQGGSFHAISAKNGKPGKEYVERFSPDPGQSSGRRRAKARGSAIPSHHPYGLAIGLGARRAKSATGLQGGGEEDHGEGEIHEGDGEEGVIERLSSDEPFPHHGDKKPHAAEREQARDEVFLPGLHASSSGGRTQSSPTAAGGRRPLRIGRLNSR